MALADVESVVADGVRRDVERTATDTRDARVREKGSGRRDAGLAGRFLSLYFAHYLTA